MTVVDYWIPSTSGETIAYVTAANRSVYVFDVIFADINIA
ncbi:hypothetical protein AAW51_5241 [Caldimonas brevitalea]|uniref:Uncharacterized protein n=1 Tax=Caldimonas brevitalea TaxID=413882 RepID=A0A0G3BR82_9BURK|nr:hypothetical protein AAW51_5241 [Caldimonas brevitalea]